MKLITNFTQAVTSVFKNYTQTILLIIGLILINFGVLALLNVGAFLICAGLSMIAVAFLINYEKKEVRQ